MPDKEMNNEDRSLHNSQDFDECEILWNYSITKPKIIYVDDLFSDDVIQGDDINIIDPSFYIMTEPPKIRFKKNGVKVEVTKSYMGENGCIKIKTELINTKDHEE